MGEETGNGSSSGGSSSSGSSGGAPGDASTDSADSSGADASSGGHDAGPRSDVLAIMQRAADWQIAEFGTTHNETWAEAVFYAGLMAAYRTTGQAKYLQTVEAWGTANQWTLGSPPPKPTMQTVADTQCAGQSFLEVYAIDGKPAELTSTQQSLDAIIAAGMPGRSEWWWEDALFMAPGTYVRAGQVTSQSKYFDAMSTMWWDTTAYLQDPQSGLFWRDATYFNKTCPNGQKMFWSRGNGWVIAGIARVLDHLPATHPAHGMFVSLLQQLAGAIAPLQRSDGYWSSCLTDANDYPEPESSGTAAFVYAIAWGLNRGFLPAAQYGTVVQNGWNALVAAVDSAGELGWVQAVGAAPGASTATDTAPYGVGLFLLAGSEVATLPPP
jgi:rhamnogalacturonyl hydrolase YesR